MPANSSKLLPFNQLMRLAPFFCNFLAQHLTCVLLLIRAFITHPFSPTSPTGILQTHMAEILQVRPAAAAAANMTCLHPLSPRSGCRINQSLLLLRPNPPISW
jgi:hypothetical protein